MSASGAEEPFAELDLLVSNASYRALPTLPAEFATLADTEELPAQINLIAATGQFSGRGTRLTAEDIQSLDLSTDEVSTAPLSLRARHHRDRLAGQRFVEVVAGIAKIAPRGGEVPWDRSIEPMLDEHLSLTNTSRAWAVGVLRVLADAKAAVDEKLLAAGFLVLSRFSHRTLNQLLPGIDFSKTCEAGCSHSADIVRVAARFTRGELHLDPA